LALLLSPSATEWAALLAVTASIMAIWGYLFVLWFRHHLASFSLQGSSDRKIKSTTKNQTGRLSAGWSAHLPQADCPFVSIIVPARNEEEHIGRCLDSLLAQDYPEFEIIAVDDNSTDSTLQIMKSIEDKAKGRLKVISLVDKPEGWTGKTWASQQGYVQSKGSLVLFTDADTFYKDRRAVSLAVSYMQDRGLDVLTGLPRFELRDFWSKSVMPLWNLFLALFGADMARVNNPKSKTAYLMGCFSMMYRSVYEGSGTFGAVRQEIQEDKALGERIKHAGYRLEMVKIDRAVTALWSRDGKTLWHGITRSLVPSIIQSRRRTLGWTLLIFFMGLLPVALLPLSLSFSGLPFFSVLPFNIGIGTVGVGANILSAPYGLAQLLPLFLDIACLCMIIAAVAIKTYSMYRITPAYSIFFLAGAAFLLAAYISSMAQAAGSAGKGSVVWWRGRKYIYNSAGMVAEAPQQAAAQVTSPHSQQYKARQASAA